MFLSKHALPGEVVFFNAKITQRRKGAKKPHFLNWFSISQALFKVDWDFFAPLRLCVIFALKKISLAEVLGDIRVKKYFLLSFSFIFHRLIRTVYIKVKVI
jgi:hypothetical protein